MCQVWNASNGKHFPIRGRRLFSPEMRLEARIVVCDNCGAPLPAPEAGGRVTCEYCGAPSTVAVRPFEARELPAVATLSVDDRRLRKLRATARLGVEGRLSFNNVPDAFEDIDGMDMSDETLERLEKAFVAAQRAFGDDQDPGHEHALHWLARRIANVHAFRDQSRKALAYLQQAAERMVDDDYRELLFTELASVAITDGRLDDAEGLAQCDAESTELECDSAYRSTRASLEIARRRYDDAIMLLGTSIDAIPTAAEDVPAMGVKRTLALEALGRAEAAEEALLETVEWTAAYQLEHNGGASAGKSVVKATRKSALQFVAKVASKAGNELCAAVWDRLHERDRLPSRKNLDKRAKRKRAGKKAPREESGIDDSEFEPPPYVPPPAPVERKGPPPLIFWAVFCVLCVVAFALVQLIVH